MMMDYKPLNKVFTQKDLKWLDQILPGAKKNTKDGLNKTKKMGFKARALGCCGVRQRNAQSYDVDGNDDDVFRPKPDVVLKIGEDIGRKSNPNDAINNISNGPDTDNMTSTLEPLLDNGSNVKVE